MAAERHSIVADFPRRNDAAAAMSRLSRAGFHPEDVSIVMSDPELARDLGGRSYVRFGVVVGALVGVLFTVVVVVMGGKEMPITSSGLLIGAGGTIAGLGFIGIVFGRSLVKRSADAAVFAKAVECGDVLLAVVCSGESCDRAHHMLADAGATDVREEDSAGPA